MEHVPPEKDHAQVEIPAHQSAQRQHRALEAIAVLHYAEHRPGPQAQSPTQVVEKDGLVTVTWPVSAEQTGSAVFNLDEKQPLIEALGVGENAGETAVIARKLNPVTVLTVGSRNLQDPAGWVAFFDKTSERPREKFPVKLGKRTLRVSQEGNRTTVSLAEASAGSAASIQRSTLRPSSESGVIRLTRAGGGRRTMAGA